MFLPAAFRKVLQGAGEQGLVMRKDVFQPCLVLYPESVWGEQMDLLRSRLSRWDKGEQQLFRQFVSEVEAVALDANGRFLIPRRCLRQAAIAQDVRFIGMGDTIEIWAAAGGDALFVEQPAFADALQKPWEAPPRPVTEPQGLGAPARPRAASARTHGSRCAARQELLIVKYGLLSRTGTAR